MLNKYYLKEYIDNSDCNAPDDVVYWLVDNGKIIDCFNEPVLDIPVREVHI